MKHTIIRDRAEDKPQTGAVLRVEYARPIWRGVVVKDQIGTTRETVRLMRLDNKELEEVIFTACSQVSIRVKPPKK
jgi:hypothetical protein